MHSDTVHSASPTAFQWLEREYNTWRRKWRDPEFHKKYASVNSKYQEEGASMKKFPLLNQFGTCPIMLFGIQESLASKGSVWLCLQVRKCLIKWSVTSRTREREFIDQSDPEI